MPYWAMEHHGELWERLVNSIDRGSPSDDYMDQLKGHFMFIAEQYNPT